MTPIIIILIASLCGRSNTDYARNPLWRTQPHHFINPAELGMESWAIVCCTIVVVNSKLQPLPDEYSLRMSISNCVTEASSTFFAEGDIVAVALAIKEVAASKPSAVVLDRIMFTQMFSRYKVSLTMRKLIKPMVIERFLKTIDNYVIQIRYLEDIATNLEVLVKDSSWNPHARFLVITATVFKNNSETAAHIIKQLWQRKVTNGVVLLPAGDENSTLEAYSWFPFNNGLCGAGYDQVCRLMFQLHLM